MCFDGKRTVRLLGSLFLVGALFGSRRGKGGVNMVSNPAVPLSGDQ